jgi:methylglutaconyl-CoA hydratase
MSPSYETLLVDTAAGVCRVDMNRPDMRNAFNATMILELMDFFTQVATSDDVRVVVLGGRGKSFCAGADLGWMKKVALAGTEANIAGARELSRLFSLVNECAKPVVARVHGAAIGGGAGLVACCDIPIAVEAAKFGFSEVRLGLAPAVISPFVVGRIGPARARELFVTGARFDGKMAAKIELVNRVVPDEKALDIAIAEVTQDIVKGGPEAVAVCKNLAMTISDKTHDEAVEMTSALIARLRAEPEAQEGMLAFLQRRQPKWCVESDQGEGSS